MVFNMRRAFSHKSYGLRNNQTNWILTLCQKSRAVELIMIKFYMGCFCSNAAFIELFMSEY
jgi:hypothetical protein